MRGCISIIVSVATLTSCAGTDSRPGGFAATDCYATLRHSQHFSWGRVGFAASVPEEARALDGLLARPDARASMKSLFAKENAATTRLWALSGLYFADPEAFRQGVGELRGSGAGVAIMEGCIASETTMGEVVWSDDPGVLVLDDPATAADDLAKATIGNKLDIAHGGIPAAIRSMKEESPSPCALASQSSALPQQ